MTPTDTHESATREAPADAPRVPGDAPGVPGDAEALFKEARQRGRRRRLGVAAAIAMAAAVVIVVVVLVGGSTHATDGGVPAASAPTAGNGVLPKQPGAMAVSASGTLYVVDAARDQVLRLTRAGKFVVFAGSGRRGFSGDGGPATRARLRLNDWSGIAVGPDGTVYVADTGNDRVRAILPSGRIETVAGNGRSTLRLRSWKGTRAALGLPIGQPRGLAVAANGLLYIGATDLISLRPGAGGGAARWIAGTADFIRTKFGSMPTLKSRFGNIYGSIAVDRDGNVYAANFPNLYERTAGGKLLALGTYRAGGDPGQLFGSRDGAVYGATLGGIFRLHGDDPAVSADRHYIASNRRIDRALKWPNLARAAVIAPPDGVAVAPDGAIYYDADSGDGYVPGGAVAEITPAGRVRVLWRAHH